MAVATGKNDCDVIVYHLGGYYFALGDFDYLFRLPKAINDYVDEMIAKDKDLTEVRTDFIRKVDKWFKANKFAEKYKAMK